MDADQIEKIAKDANDTSTKAFNLLTKTLEGEGKTSQEIEELNKKCDPSVDLRKHLSVCLCVTSCLTACLSYHLSVCLCLSDRLYVRLVTCLSI